MRYDGSRFSSGNGNYIQWGMKAAIIEKSLRELASLAEPMYIRRHSSVRRNCWQDRNYASQDAGALGTLGVNIARTFSRLPVDRKHAARSSVCYF